MRIFLHSVFTAKTVLVDVRLTVVTTTVVDDPEPMVYVRMLSLVTMEIFDGTSVITLPCGPVVVAC